eukprot:403360331
MQIVDKFEINRKQGSKKEVRQRPSYDQGRFLMKSSSVNQIQQSSAKVNFNNKTIFRQINNDTNLDQQRPAQNYGNQTLGNFTNLNHINRKDYQFLNVKMLPALKGKQILEQSINQPQSRQRPALSTRQSDSLSNPILNLQVQTQTSQNSRHTTLPMVNSTSSVSASVRFASDHQNRQSLIYVQQLQDKNSSDPSLLLSKQTSQSNDIQYSQSQSTPAVYKLQPKTSKSISQSKAQEMKNRIRFQRPIIKAKISNGSKLQTIAESRVQNSSQGLNTEGYDQDIETQLQGEIQLSINDQSIDKSKIFSGNRQYRNAMSLQRQSSNVSTGLLERELTGISKKLEIPKQKFNLMSPQLRPNQEFRHLQLQKLGSLEVINQVYSSELNNIKQIDQYENIYKLVNNPFMDMRDVKCEFYQIMKNIDASKLNLDQGLWVTQLLYEPVNSTSFITEEINMIVELYCFNIQSVVQKSNGQIRRIDNIQIPFKYLPFLFFLSEENIHEVLLQAIEVDSEIEKLKINEEKLYSLLQNLDPAAERREIEDFSMKISFTNSQGEKSLFLINVQPITLQVLQSDGVSSKIVIQENIPFSETKKLYKYLKKRNFNQNELISKLMEISSFYRDLEKDLAKISMDYSKLEQQIQGKISQLNQSSQTKQFLNPNIKTISDDQSVSDSQQNEGMSPQKLNNRQSLMIPTIMLDTYIKIKYTFNFENWESSLYNLSHLS